MCLEKGNSNKQNITLKIEHFLLKIGFDESSFCQSIDNFLSLDAELLKYKLGVI